MNFSDERMDRARREAPEIAHEGDDHETGTEGSGGEEHAAAPDASAPPAESNVVHTTSPYAETDVREGITFEQRDPATLHAREFGERLIH